MTEYSFQESMVRFLMDKKVRDAVYSKDPVIQAEFHLLPEHVDRLLQIDYERIKVFASVIEHKHIGNLVFWIPYTGKVIGEHLHKLAHRFYFNSFERQEIDLKNSIAFAEYVKTQLNGDSFPLYVKDILEYEINELKLLVRMMEMPDDTETDQLKAEGLDSKPNDGDMMKMFPKHTSNNRIFYLKNNIFGILKQIDKGQPVNVPEFQQGISVMIYVKQKKLERCIVNNSTIKFITACNGRKSLEEIIKEFADKEDCGNQAVFEMARKECVALSDNISKMGVIEFLAMPSLK